MVALRLLLLFLTCMSWASEFTQVPIIDLGRADAVVASEIRLACRHVGFFYIRNYGEDTFPSLEAASRHFFATATPEERARLAMRNAGKAWRGYFPVGDEFTSGLPDQKEGWKFLHSLALFG